MPLLSSKKNIENWKDPSFNVGEKHRKSKISIFSIMKYIWKEEILSFRVTKTLEKMTPPLPQLMYSKIYTIFLTIFTTWGVATSSRRKQTNINF